MNAEKASANLFLPIPSTILSLIFAIDSPPQIYCKIMRNLPVKIIGNGQMKNS